jgi:outer membrane protein OmpA-like peptidoglycan-associated protein
MFRSIGMFRSIDLCTTAMPVQEKGSNRFGAVMALGYVGAALLVAAAAPAEAKDVQMFDRPPTVEELRSLLQPEAPAPTATEAPAAAEAPRRTRSIEILGDAGLAAQKQSRKETPAAYTPAPQPETAPTQPVQPAAVTEPAAAPQGQPAPAAAEATSVGFRINFAFNSTVIPQDAKPYLERVGQFMQAEPQMRLLVEGHTDAVGGDAYNMALSQRRALAVATWLVEAQRIDPGRLAVQGKGETEPLVSNPNDGLNRRVQFVPVN